MKVSRVHDITFGPQRASTLIGGGLPGWKPGTQQEEDRFPGGETGGVGRRRWVCGRGVGGGSGTVTVLQPHLRSCSPAPCPGRTGSRTACKASAWQCQPSSGSGVPASAPVLHAATPCTAVTPDTCDAHGALSAHCVGLLSAWLGPFCVT